MPWRGFYFQANHFAEASVTFRDIALHHADTPVGIYASQLYLESINVLGGNERDELLRRHGPRRPGLPRPLLQGWQGEEPTPSRAGR